MVYVPCHNSLMTGCLVYLITVTVDFPFIELHLSAYAYSIYGWSVCFF